MLPTEKTIKILAIGGGGVMGVGPATLLKMVEKDLSTKIHQHIDGVAGTSTGSIIAASVAFGDPMATIESLYVNKSIEIFKKRKFPFNLNPFGPKYDIANLRKLLLKQYRNRKISHSKIPIWIPLGDAVAGNELVWNDQDTVNMEYAVSCSCAAPTYFNPIDGRYVDGSLVANDPSMIAIAGMVKRYGIPLNKISLLTLNTNGDKTSAFKPKPWWTPLNWVAPMIKFQMEVSEDTVRYMTTHLGLEDSIYISPNFHCELDDVTKVNECSDAWKKIYTENKDVILDWIRK